MKHGGHAAPAPNPAHWLSDDASLPPEDRLEDGSDTDLESLYRAEAPRLLRQMSRRTADRDEAQDLVQEVFARLARLTTWQWRRVETPQAYLGQVAGNLLKDRARDVARRRPHLHVVADENVLAGHDQGRHLEHRDMLQRLDTAMLRLKPRTRDIFIAHRVHGMSYAEIAERTGLSKKGVEKQMAKAIAQIGRLMGRS